MTRKTDEPAAKNATRPEGAGMSGDTVAEYLKSHPDFFADRLELLSEMAAPARWSGDGVVDMQRFLLERRLGEIEELRNCAQEVIETSRTNMSVQTRTHAAVLALLAVKDLDQLGRVVDDDLPLLLDVDAVVLGLEPGAGAKRVIAAAPEATALADGTVDALLGVDENVRLFRDMADDGSVFGSAAGLVRSAAVARLRPSLQVPPGFIALGSRGSAFHPGQGTELIGFMARVFEQCLHRLVEEAG